MTWGDQLGTILRALGYGKGGAGGSATPVIVSVLVVTAVAAAVATAIEAVRDAPRARRLATGVALVGLCCGAVWAQVTPAMHVADETDHFAYVQYLGETGNLPGRASRSALSGEQRAVMEATAFFEVVGQPSNPVPTSALRDRGVDAALAREQLADDGGGPTAASSQPPAYYLLAAGLYSSSRALGSDLLTSLLVVRLFGALLLGALAVVGFAFTREVLPGRTGLAALGGLVLALQPSVGHLFAGAHPDGLTILLASVALWLVARTIRRGATPATAAVLGAVFGFGATTKVAFILFGAPLGAAVLILLLWRRTPRAAAAFVLAAAAPPIAYVLWSIATDHPLWAPVANVPTLPAEQIRPFQLREFASYVWQLYLPDPGFLIDQFPRLEGPAWRDIWVYGTLGRFGWLDTGLSSTAYGVGQFVLLAFAAMALAAVVRHRYAMRRRAFLLVALLTSFVSLALSIAWAGYGYIRSTTLVFEQARYLWLFIALYALMFPLAALALGRRRALVLAAATVPVLVLHFLVGLGAVTARYYG